jgi:hypothetical protein
MRRKLHPTGPRKLIGRSIRPGVKPEAMAILAMSVLLEVADNHRHRAEQIGG